jgi:predicted lipoprotein with Yx(FWY)xxD motif
MGVMLYLKSLLARRRTIVAAATSVILLLATGAAAATVPSLGVAKRTVNGKSSTIVVDGHGVTVYALGGESLANLKCINQTCFKVWTPLKVSSATARPRVAAGVLGTVSIMHRVKGRFFQVMLDRHPLYYFSGDKGKPGSTKGQGINSFGGAWHVVKASTTTTAADVAGGAAVP